MRIGAIIFLTLILGLLPAGCIPQHTKPLERPPETEEERNFESVWQACRTTLRKYGFPLDRQDRRDGVITTTAASGGHLFEVWRKDSATIFNYRENTIQHIYRAARVQIRRIEGTKRFSFTVEIAMARSDKIQQQFTDASELGIALGHSRRHQKKMPEMRFNDLIRPKTPITPSEDTGPAATAKPPRPRATAPSIPECPVVPLGRDRDLEMHLGRTIESQCTGGEYVSSEQNQETDK
ncbi:MAG: hypothetical protein K8S55_03375 [Phycisphaerae bacterium]|nr:hypothetical protein [Phycisphaerae bacterium]